MKAAINDESKTSDTPYSFVVSIRSSEKAIPGRTLIQWSMLVTEKRNNRPNLAKKIRRVAGITR